MSVNSSLADSTGPEPLEIPSRSLASSDHLPINDAARGDSTAVRAIYEHFSARVYTIVRRLAGDDATAEDFAQEAWIRILRGLPAFRGDSQLGSWIHRIAVNTALHGRMREKRISTREEEFAAAPVRDAGVARAKDDQVLLRMQLEEALDQLPEGMRRIVVLHDIEGYSHEEIAAVMGTGVSTSRSQLGRARAKLRALLERDDATTIPLRRS